MFQKSVSDAIVWAASCERTFGGIGNAKAASEITTFFDIHKLSYIFFSNPLLHLPISLTGLPLLNCLLPRVSRLSAPLFIGELSQSG